MKKFTKVCLIFAVVLLIMGTGISVAAAAMGANLGDIAHLNIGNSWGGYWDHYEWNDRYRSRKNVTENKEDWFVDVRDLNISVNAGEVQMETSDSIDKIQIKSDEGDGTCLMYMDGDTLKVELDTTDPFLSDWEYDNPKLIIVVPTGYEFDEVEVDVSAGSFVAEEIFAKELDVDMRAGAARIEYGKVEKFSGDCAAGELIYYGQVTKEVSGDCSAGSISIQLIGREVDYNYEIRASAGSVSVGGRTYVGLGRKNQIINEGATGSMELECSAGVIEVDFDEES